MTLEVYTITFTAPVWVYPGQAGWRFVSVPKKESKKIKQLFGGIACGFGSLRVQVRIGESVWKTSIFPDSKQGVYLLPLKASVRAAEQVHDGSTVRCTVQLVDL